MILDAIIDGLPPDAKVARSPIFYYMAGPQIIKDCLTVEHGANVVFVRLVGNHIVLEREVKMYKHFVTAGSQHQERIGSDLSLLARFDLNDPQTTVAAIVCKILSTDIC